MTSEYYGFSAADTDALRDGETGEPVFLAERCCSEKTTAALVGGGGKTTLMYYLAEVCAACGKRVLVSTTTHILRPAHNYAETAEEVRTIWSENIYAVIGTPCENGKLTAPSPSLYRSLAEDADLILLEADGSKRMPVKIPADHEPVIPPDCTLVIGVMGLSALGQRMEDCCFRFCTHGGWLGAGPDAILDEDLAARILSHPQGTRKNTEGREYCVLLNQCDDAERREQAKNIQSRLEQVGIPAFPCCFPRKWRNI